MSSRSVRHHEGKEAVNLAKHGRSLADAGGLFERGFDEHIDTRHDYSEVRWIATGPVAKFDDRLHVAVYTWRDGTRWIISFRKANDREVRNYRRKHS